MVNLIVFFFFPFIFHFNATEDKSAGTREIVNHLLLVEMCSNSRITSSFHGKIFEVAGISVDNFEEHNLQSRAFFLSHCHSDHTKGLFSSKLLRTLECNGIYIYMSELTAAIISDDCNEDPSLMNKIVKLDYGM